MDDLPQRLRKLNKCIRCDCPSCSSGYENHSHHCTEGPGCIKAIEGRLLQAQRLALMAADRIESLTSRE